VALMAVFPRTEILDEGTRANENPLSDSGNWSGPMQSGNGALKIVSNQIVNDAADDADGNRYRSSQTYGPDCEAFCTIAAVNTTNNAYLYVRCVNPGGGSLDGYFAQQHGGDGVVRLYRIDDNTLTQLGSNITQAFSSGDGFGVSMVGTTLEVWRRSSGVWSSLGTRIDATYSAAGYIGMGEKHSTATPGAYTNFGGGTRPPGLRGHFYADTIADGEPVLDGWTAVKGTSSFGSGNWLNGSSGGNQDLWVMTGMPCGSVDQFAVLEFEGPFTGSVKAYLIFRYTGPLDPYYVLIFDGVADTVTWKRQNLALTIDDTIGAATALTVNVDDVFCATIEGTGTATTVRVWRNPTVQEVRSASDVGGDTTPDVTFTDNPATPVDVGPYVGFGASASAAGDFGVDRFEGGDCTIAKMELCQSTFTYNGPLMPRDYAEADLTIRIDGGVGRIVYLDADTAFAGAGFTSTSPWTLVDSSCYARIATNMPDDAQGFARLKVLCAEDSSFQIEMTTSRCRVISYMAGFTAGTNWHDDAGINPDLYRWMRFRVSADGLTMYWDRAPDDLDGLNPGAWVNLGSCALSAVADFRATRCYVTLDMYRDSGATGDVWGEFDGLNTSRQLVRLSSSGPWQSNREWRGVSGGPI
jgi:hypothetical protein